MIRLKELREQKGMTQTRLSFDLNTTQNSLSRYESGEREMDYAMLIKVADYFGVSIDYLLGRTDKKWLIKWLTSKHYCVIMSKYATYYGFKVHNLCHPS